MGPSGMGLLAPTVPGGTYQVALSIGGQVVANGKMNLVQVSYDLPTPPVLLRGQTTKIGIELRGLAGLDQFVQGRPVEVTTLLTNTPEIVVGIRSQTPLARPNPQHLTDRFAAPPVVLLWR